MRDSDGMSAKKTLNPKPQVHFCWLIAGRAQTRAGSTLGGPQSQTLSPFLLADRRQGSDTRRLNSRGSGGSGPRRTRSHMHYDDMEKERVAEPPSLASKSGGDKTRKRFKKSKPKRFEFQDEKTYGHGESFFPGLDR